MAKKVIDQSEVGDRRSAAARTVRAERRLWRQRAASQEAQGQGEHPSPDEIRALLAASTGRQKAMLVVAVFSGLRASEIRGLRWQDVDFDRKLLLVRVRADMSGNLGALKSESSRRDIPMSPMLLNTLREWKLACPKGELRFVFPGRGGGVPSHNLLMDCIGGQVHRFRHFYASWLIDQGFGPKRCQQLLGHSSIKVTFDTYGHLFPQEDDHDRLAAAELALLVG
jgi:integrase